MKYRTLGKTNQKVSVVGIGTWQFGGEWGKTFEQTEVDAMFRRGKELGINLVDTAECYGDHTSEALVGAAVQQDRGDWFIATKFGHKFHKAFTRTDERSADDVVKQLEGSLKALRTDYVDLLQYHSVRDTEADDQAVRDVLAKLVKDGKVRFVGNSVGSNDNMHQVGNATAVGVSVIQLIYNRLDRKPEERTFASCIEQNLGVLARVPLASGFLSGKYKPGATFDESDVRSRWKDRDQDEKLQQVEEISRTEVPAGVPMAQWALAWCLQHPAVSSVIPGCKNVAQVESNAAAAELDYLVRDDHPQAWRGAAQ
ncbi:MAG TPA: aldo/keto reductase [Tepidisphaeraceae bacterium]|jgi:aryl-alcohol dehydrogenase-like predicted oxidoreductase|nr:aldo/keto reductase [Tepidisphaeraceae bacterium]